MMYKVKVQFKTAKPHGTKCVFGNHSANDSKIKINFRKKLMLVAFGRQN